MTDRMSLEQWTYFHAASALVRAASIAGHKVDGVLRDHGLTFARYEVLLLLSWSRRGQAGLTRIGDQLLVHQASITGLVDRLEADGLVRRIRHTSDRRVTLAQITNQGRGVAASATQTISAQLQLGITESAAEEVFALVQKLRRSAHDIAGS